MRSVRWLVLGALVGMSCSEIKVPVPPGLDAWPDRGTVDAPDQGAEGPGDPGVMEVAPDVPLCQKDEECAYLLPNDDSGCLRARCDGVKGCVLENLPEGDPCGAWAPIPPECHRNRCDGNGHCVPVEMDDGTPCDPGVPPEPCTVYSCLGGQCAASPGCDDGNPCTEDSCVIEMGTCQHAPLTGGPCQDDDPCTIQESCFAGMCLGKPNPCEDDNPCTDDRCAKETGCVHPPISDAPCDDGNACTRDDACQNGQCKPGAHLVCNDGNRCTLDQCNPATGECVFTPTTAVCDDGDPCTDPDECNNGECVGTPRNCDDQDPCTADSCQPGTGCVHPVVPGCKPCATDPDCNDGNPCTADACLGGECGYEALTGTPCNDGNSCTIGDACEDGICAPGSPKDCNDGNGCTDDSCDPSTGQCAHTFNALACDDGNPCTLKDQCAQGVCAGTPISCDDGNVCTDDKCNPANGQCMHSYNNQDCNDGKFCTVNDRCTQGACTGTAVTCNDNNPCTKDSCDEANDRCVNEPIAGCLNCTLDKDCNDGNACTQDKCVSSKCEFTPLTGTACEDGNKCTEKDTCQSGQCQPGPPVLCAPRTCHSVSCDAALGCVYTPLTGGACDDGDACTGPDQCIAGSCVAGPLLCCAGRPDGTPCSDQNDATGPDFCLAEKCRGFMVVPFRAGDQTGLTAVDAAAGGVATGWYKNANDKFATAFVAEVPFGAKPKAISATMVNDGRLYRSISSWLAVGDGGLVAYRPAWGSSWVVGGILAEVLGAIQPYPGNLTDVFGRLGPDPGGFCICCRADSYLLGGRDQDNSQAWTRHCTIYQQLGITGGCTTKAKCGEYRFLGLDPGSVFPVAVHGLPSKECPGACLDEAAVVARLASPLGIFQTASFLGENEGGFVETFRFLATAATPGYQARDAVRLRDLDLGDIYLAVGDAGTVLMIEPRSGNVSPLEILDAQERYDFTGIAVGEDAGYLFISGVRRLDNGGLEMALIAHPLAASVGKYGSYFPMTLRTCNPKNNGCMGFSLDDATVAGFEVTAVGNALVDNAPSGIVFFLKI